MANEESAPLRSDTEATYGIRESRSLPEFPRPVDTATEDSTQQERLPADAAFATLARRTRCLFTILTAPIPPMIILVGAAMVWFFFVSVRYSGEGCRQMQTYAICTAALATYTPIHYHHRRIPHVFMRQWDQCFHTIVVFYVYAGLTLVQSCRRGTNSGIELDDENNNNHLRGSNHTDPIDPALLQQEQHHENQCAGSCPEIYQALTAYVGVLQALIVCLVLPLLCLPLVYVWFIRQSGDAQTRINELLREQMQDDELVSSNGNVRATEVLGALQPVQLLVDAAKRVWSCSIPTARNSESDAAPKEVKGIPECCICMEPFELVEGIRQPLGDIEEQLGSNRSNNNRIIVQAPRCGHLFHHDCIAGWVGGQWNDENNPDANQQRRARRTTCPLCRTDLRPA